MLRKKLLLPVIVFIVTYISNSFSSGAALWHYRADGDDDGGNKGVIMMDIASGSHRQIYPSFVPGDRIDMSPDGKKIAVMHTGKLVIMDNDGGNAHTAHADIGSGDAKMMWAKAGIFWCARRNNKTVLLRFIPESKAFQTVMEFTNQTKTTAPVYWCSLDGRKAFVKANYAPAVGPRGYKAFVEFSADFKSHKMKKMMEWGHGMVMSNDGLHVMHFKFDHKHIKDFLFESVDNISEPKVLWPPMGTGYKINNAPGARCPNNDALIGWIAHHPDTKEKITFIYNWKTNKMVDSIKTLPGFKVRFDAFWYGSPLPGGTEPYISLSTAEIVCAVQNETQPVVKEIAVTNTGASTLGKVTAAPSTAADWLSVKVEGNGGNTQKITCTIDPSKITADVAVDVKVSGGGAVNSPTFTVKATKGNLAAPGSLKAEVGGERQQDVTLTWTDNSTNEKGFIIERKSGIEFNEIHRTQANVTTWTENDVPTDEHFYRVRAFDDNGESANSSEILIRVDGIPFIELTSPGENFSILQGSMVTIKWASNLVPQVKFFYSTDEGLTYNIVEEVSGMAASKGAYEWTAPADYKGPLYLKMTDYEENIFSKVVKGTLTDDPSLAAGNFPKVSKTPFEVVRCVNGGIKLKFVIQSIKEIGLYSMNGRCLHAVITDSKTISLPKQIVAGASILRISQQGKHFYRTLLK